MTGSLSRSGKPSGRILFMAGSAVLALAIVISGLGMAGGKRRVILAGDLMSGVTAREVAGRAADSAFISAAADFGVELFRQCAAQEGNALCAPLSVYTALAMAANGASGETLAQMEACLGGALTIGELNEYLYALRGRMDGSTLAQADAIWFREDEAVSVSGEFLQANADYYGAAASKAPFDPSTAANINSWVSEKTGGRIDGVVDEISPISMMFLLSAVSFEAEWQSPYKAEAVADGQFTTGEGETRSCRMMRSEESLFIPGDNETGFIKPYVGGFSLVALLPAEGLSLEEYISTLTGKELLRLTAGAVNTPVIAYMPRFESQSGYELSHALAAMGMPAAFSQTAADFTGMGSFPDRLFIGSITHRAAITVDELGTRAGAAASVEMATRSAMSTNVVSLDRPFIYAIIDDATGLPVFIGSVTDI